MKKNIVIAVGIILNQERTHVFLTQRMSGAHLGGLWEFAGGKVEPDEAPEQAMCRELHEEVGISVTEYTHFEAIEYDYPEKSLHLDFFLVTDYIGMPFGKEGQKGEWVALNLVNDYRFPEANQPVLCRLAALTS